VTKVGRAEQPRNLALLRPIALIAGGSLVLALIIWQDLTAYGHPDAARHIGSVPAMLDTGVLVFREGLESILVLAAIVVSMESRATLRTPIKLGAGIGLIATGLTWLGGVRSLRRRALPQRASSPAKCASNLVEADGG
jgi:high-affinity iron transporter